MKLKKIITNKLGITTLILDEVYSREEEKRMFEVLFSLLEREKYFLEFYWANIYYLENNEIKQQLDYSESYFLKHNEKYEYINKDNYKVFNIISTFTVTDNNINEIKKIWDTYGEISIFKPNKNFSWEKFREQYIKDNAKLKIDYYMLNDYTDIEFTKPMDDGFMMIKFNSNKINVDNLLTKINSIIN